MKQQTFRDYEYGKRKRKTKREEFLKGQRGRPPRKIETKLRMYPVQAWFSLSDEGVEDAI